MHAGGSYPTSGLSVEITPLLLLCGVSAWSLWQSGYKVVLELCSGGGGKASSLLPVFYGLVLMGSNSLHGCPEGFI